MVLATHLSCGCVVLGASEEGQFVEGVVGCEESKRASGIEGCRAVWLGKLKGMSLMCRVFEVMKKPAEASARDACRAGSDSG